MLCHAIFAIYTIPHPHEPVYGKSHAVPKAALNQSILSTYVYGKIVVLFWRTKQVACMLFGVVLHPPGGHYCGFVPLLIHATVAFSTTNNCASVPTFASYSSFLQGIANWCEPVLQNISKLEQS